MGWSFRRSIRLGPLKFNLSKSGIGASLGIPGFRVGKDAKGRVYQQTSFAGNRRLSQGLFEFHRPGSATAKTCRGSSS